MSDGNDNIVNIYNTFGGRGSSCSGHSACAPAAASGSSSCTATTTPCRDDCTNDAPAAACNDAPAACNDAPAACCPTDHAHTHTHTHAHCAAADDDVDCGEAVCYHNDCSRCAEFHDFGHEYECEHETEYCHKKPKTCVAKCCFSKRMLIASGDMTNTLAPWDQFNAATGSEEGLARKLFIAAMEARGLVEDCDYQFVSATYTDIVAADGTAGPLMQSGYVDAVLGLAPTADRRNNFLFGLPFHDADTPTGTDFGVGLTVNKKSPCAKKLIHTFNAGLKRILENGTYCKCILDFGDDSFEHWKEVPTADTRPELFALLGFEESCHRKSRDCSGACKFDHTLLIAHGNGPAPWDGVDAEGRTNGLAREIFRAVMACRHYKEECDYQFVTPARAQVMVGDMVTETFTSGFADAALTWEPNAARRNSALFGVPMNDDETAGTFGFALMINKKSACAMELQRAWNAGMARIVCNGTYQLIVDEFGDASFTPWAEPPTSVTHPELFDLIVHKDCGDVCDDEHDDDCCTPCVSRPCSRPQGSC